MSPTERLICRLIAEAGEITNTELSSESGIPYNATRTCTNRLIRAGYIVRVRVEIGRNSGVRAGVMSRTAKDVPPGEERAIVISPDPDCPHWWSSADPLVGGAMRAMVQLGRVGL